MNTPTQAVYTTPNNSTLTSVDPAAGGTVIFLKEAALDSRDGDSGGGGNTFVPLYHHHSITLRDLAEEYNISSVLECDADGTVQPRAVAFDSPSDVLRSGRHYIVRRDVKTEDGGNRVTFRGKILVKEYDLDHHHTPSNSMALPSGGGGASSALGSCPATTERGGRLAPGTPFLATRVRNDAEEEGEETHDGDAQRRRPVPTEAVSSGGVATGSAAGNVATDKENAITGGKRGRESDEEANSASVGEVVLTDRTNTLSNAPASNLAKPTPTAATVPPPAKPQMRFLPFTADLHGTGSEVMVHLEDLAALCKDADALEEHNAKRHEEAEAVFESARRILSAAATRR